MDAFRLTGISDAFAEAIETYRAETHTGGMRVTHTPDRIPGLDGLEDFESASDWIEYTRSMAGKISWYLSVREGDNRIIGAVVLRHRLEYDDDDIDFASHIGYSIHPAERNKGYAKAQLGLALLEAKKLGLDSVRIVCRDTNTASRRTILANGGEYVDSIYGEESGMTIERYDIRLG